MKLLQIKHVTLQQIKKGNVPLKTKYSGNVLSVSPPGKHNTETKKNSRNNFSWGLTSNKEALFLDTLTAHTVLHMIESGDMSG